MDRKIKIFVVLLGLALASVPSDFVYGQTCPDCGSPRTYSTSAPTGVGLAGGNWTGGGDFSNGEIAKFEDGRDYIWTANNNFNLGGIILRGGSNLTLDRSNQGNQPSFTISGNCIVIGAGSTLNLIYITSLENVSICIEEGGKLVMDSRREDRDDFIFDGVTIDLQGPGAELEFGQAEIVIEGEDGLIITGWTGDAVCTGDPLSPPSSEGSSGNISWTGDTNICEILNFNILPVDYLYFQSEFIKEERSVNLLWATSKEWENSHFEVERSLNNIDNWVKVGQVHGMGFSDGPVEYQFMDDEIPFTGNFVYYRLKQVDFDGTFAYSKVVAARLPALETTNGVWRAFPNPTDGSDFRVSLMDNSQYQEEEIVFRLVHPMVYTAPQQVASEWEMNAAIQETVRKMPKGVFVVEIQWGRKVEHIKVIKK